MDDKIRKELEDDINEYFAKNMYTGWCKHWKVQYLSVRGNDVMVKPNYLQEEDIDESDDEWEAGFRTVGAKYNLRLRLPSWGYMK